MSGLWRQYHTGGVVNHAAWTQARIEGEYVGTCGACGDHLAPQPPYRHGKGRVDYTAVCRGCSHEIVAPGGRLHMGRSTKDRNG